MLEWIDCLVNFCGIVLNGSDDFLMLMQYMSMMVGYDDNCNDTDNQMILSFGFGKAKIYAQNGY